MSCRVRPERQVVLLGRVTQSVEHDPWLHARETPLGVKLEQRIEVLGEVDDHPGVDRLGRPPGPAPPAGSSARARAALARLSPREHDVAVAVAQGQANAEIGAALHMSVATVKAHISHILTKLDLANRTQIALLGHDADLV